MAPPTTASSTPPCRLDCCCRPGGGVFAHTGWFAVAGFAQNHPAPPLPCLLPCLFAHPQNQKPLRRSTCRRSRPRQPFASRSPSPCRYPTVSPRNTTSAQELGFRARGFTQTSQSWSGSQTRIRDLRGLRQTRKPAALRAGGFAADLQAAGSPASGPDPDLGPHTRMPPPKPVVLGKSVLTSQVCMNASNGFHLARSSRRLGPTSER